MQTKSYADGAMINYIKDMLSCKNAASIMRFAFILLIINGIMICWASVLASFLNAWFQYFGYKIVIQHDFLATVTAIFSTATVLKVGQKFAENKEPKGGNCG